MLIILLAYLGGVLTILSPCILPVLPFVFARAGRSFARSTLPMLAGMALTFAIVATLAAVGGGWAVRANGVGRWVALVLLALFGLDPAVPGAVRPADAAARRARLAPVGAHPGREGEHRVRRAARSCDRPAVGAVRGADPRHHLHHGRAPGREPRHDLPAARLCARRRDVAGAGAAGRRQAVRANEAVARRKRAHPPGARPPGVGRRGGHRAWPRHASARQTSTAQTAGIETGLAKKLGRSKAMDESQRRPTRWARWCFRSKARCRRSTGSAHGSTARR